MDTGNKTAHFGKVGLELTNRVCRLAGGAPGRRYRRLFTDISKSEILGCCLVMDPGMQLCCYGFVLVLEGLLL